MEGWSILRRLSGGWGVWLWFLGIRKRGGERSRQEPSPQPLPAYRERVKVQGKCFGYMNRVFPGMATGGVGRGPHSNFSGMRFSWEFSAWSQVIVLPV